MKVCPAGLASALIIGMAANALSADSLDWNRQSEEDAKQDFTTIVFDGQEPDQLACDTTVRPMPDGSWVTVMLGGGHTEPLPTNRVSISRSRDQGKTWTSMRPVDLGIKSKDPSRAITLSELMLNGQRVTMVLQVHNGGFGEWHDRIRLQDGFRGQELRLVVEPHFAVHEYLVSWFGLSQVDCRNGSGLLGIRPQSHQVAGREASGRRRLLNGRFLNRRLRIPFGLFVK